MEQLGGCICVVHESETTNRRSNTSCEKTQGLESTLSSLSIKAACSSGLRCWCFKQGGGSSLLGELEAASSQCSRGVPVVDPAMPRNARLPKRGLSAAKCGGWSAAPPLQTPPL